MRSDGRLIEKSGFLILNGFNIFPSASNYFLMIDSIYILGCKALYLFFCIFTDKPVYCDYDGKRSNHAEERM